MLKFFSDVSDNLHTLSNIFGGYESFSIDFDSRKVSKVLYQMLSYFEGSFTLTFYFYEFLCMKLHCFEYFRESGVVSSWSKTPWISKTSSSYHKTIQMFHFLHSLIKVHDISITYQGYRNMFFEFIYVCKISMSCIGLCCGSSMYGQEASSCILESLSKTYQVLVSIKAQSSFYRYREVSGFTDRLYDFKGCILVD